MGLHTMGFEQGKAGPGAAKRAIDLGQYAYRTSDIRRQMAARLQQAQTLLEFAPAVLTHPACQYLQGFALEADDVCNPV